MSYTTPQRIKNYRLGRTVGIGSFGKVKRTLADLLIERTKAS
jgi:hypothetical protein